HDTLYLERVVVAVVGVRGADPAVLKAVDVGVGVLGSVVDVGPVEEGRDPGVDALEGAGQVRGVDVLGAIQRRERIEDLDEVVVEGGVGRRAPDRRLPRVAVGVDEAGDDDVAGDVDDLGVGRFQVGADGGDLRAFDEDVAPSQVAQLRVHRDHVTTLQQHAGSHRSSFFVSGPELFRG